MKFCQDDLALFKTKMEAAGLHETVIATFADYYAQVVAGARGLIADRNITALQADELPEADSLTAYIPEGEAARPHCVMIVLNGGLGTSMGLQQAKSLLIAKEGRTFLELLVRQARGTGIHLALMNSYNTHEDTLAALADLQLKPLPRLFLQNRFPKIRQDNLQPAHWPAAPELEWNPPGHGDVYTALYISGMLDSLLQEGIRYALIANSDNLGATPHDGLLGYFSHHQLPFMMEVARRTPSDRKGGHLARHRNGRLLLRESAQCPQDDMAAFEDINRYHYFNTNNIWINLIQLKALFEKQKHIQLPLIVNPKTLDPRNPASPPVFQVESAMGAAIQLFEGATAVVVPRARFMPVKKCPDLLALRSDRYLLTASGKLALNPACSEPDITIRLDERYYKRIDDFEARFPNGPPSLKDCAALIVDGDVQFGADVVLQGRVQIRNSGTQPAVIPAQTLLANDELDIT